MSVACLPLFWLPFSQKACLESTLTASSSVPTVSEHTSSRIPFFLIPSLELIYVFAQALYTA